MVAWISVLAASTYRGLVISRERDNGVRETPSLALSLPRLGPSRLQLVTFRERRDGLVAVLKENCIDLPGMDESLDLWRKVSGPIPCNSSSIWELVVFVVC